MTDRPGRAYRMSFRAAPQALLAVDGTGVIRLASTEAERLLRRRGAELIGRPLDDVLTGDPTEPLRTRPADPEPVLAGSPLRLPDGRQVPVDVRMRRAGNDGWVVLSVDD